jgi:hypothetical protein
MYADTELMSVIIKKADVTRERVYQIIKEKRISSNHTITKQEALWLYASEIGVDVCKFLDNEQTSRLRELSKSIIIPPQRKIIKKIDKRPKTINISNQYGFIDKNLPEKIYNEAKKMAEDVYPLIYIFENSVRNLILNVLSKKFGNSWWDSKVTSSVKRKVADRKISENRNSWHGKRGAHEIYYTDIDDLIAIIKRNWSEFEEIFPKQSWIENIIDTIEVSRNTIAHNNPLNDHDIKRLKINSKDWQGQIKNMKV